MHEIVADVRRVCQSVCHAAEPGYSVRGSGVDVQGV